MRRMPWFASWRRLPAMLRPLLLLLLLLPLSLPPVLLLLGALHPLGRVPVPGDLWPDSPSLASLFALFTDVPMARALGNSLILVLLYVPLAVLLAAAAGFGLRFLSPGWKLAAYGLWIVAASIPATATWLPRFLAFQGLGLGDSWWPLLAPALMGGNALLVLLYGISLQQLPSSQIEAARLEGSSWLSVWWTVALPQVRPATLVALILATAWCWANFQDALLYLQERHSQTAPMLVYELELLGASHWPLLMAAAWLLALPLLILVWWLPGALDRSLEHR